VPQEVEVPIISRQSAHEGSKVVSHKHRPLGNRDVVYKCKMCCCAEPSGLLHWYLNITGASICEYFVTIFQHGYTSVAFTTFWFVGMGGTFVSSVPLLCAGLLGFADLGQRLDEDEYRASVERYWQVKTKILVFVGTPFNLHVSLYLKGKTILFY
jgi:hypothetical protein